MTEREFQKNIQDIVLAINDVLLADNTSVNGIANEIYNQMDNYAMSDRECKGILKPRGVRDNYSSMIDLFHELSNRHRK